MSSSVTPASSSVTDVVQTAGPLLIAYMLNWGLFGVLSLQVFLYYLAFPKDRTRTKALVYATYLVETTQTVIFTASAFQIFAENFGNVIILNQVHTFWFAAPILTGIVAFIAQAFYAYRIYILSQRKHVPCLVLFLALLQLGGSLAIGIQEHADVFSRLLNKNALVAIGIWQCSNVLCDIVIAVAMTYYLKSRDPGVAETHALVNKIIRLTVETGSLTAVISIASIILTFLPGQPSYYRTTISVLAKLYSNSMMVVLNSRMRVVYGDSVSMPSGSGVILPVSRNTRHRYNHSESVMSREEINFRVAESTFEK